jgi:transposase-like protein
MVNTMRITIKPRRIFSKELKKEIVGRIEQGTVRIRQVSREYQVSPSAIYNWIDKYSRSLRKGEILVVQKDSEEQKNMELLKRIAELERIVGQKQMEVDFLNKIIELGSEEVKLDIKKKFGGKLSNGSGSIDKGIPGK